MNSAVTPNRRYFGIIPAAGESLRMGSQKLLLPWNDATVMDQVLNAWTESQVTRVVVIVRKDNAALQNVCRHWPSIELVIPEHDPEDMKRSILVGLEHLARHDKPEQLDRWLVAPADMPTITASLINRLVKASEDSDSIVVPRFGDRRGHPISFPWPLASEASALGDHQGINALLESHPVDCLELPAGDHPDDIDTPADYARLAKVSKRTGGN